MTRSYRGGEYDIHITRSDKLPVGVNVEVTLDGAKLAGCIIAAGRGTWAPTRR